MSYKSKKAFLKNGTTEPVTSHEDECPICQEHVSTNARNHHFSAHILHMHKAAKVLFLGAKPSQARVTSSRYNYMMQIKGCGHCFCFDCLETWLGESNTCPMCRAYLFCRKPGGEKTSQEVMSYASEREYLEIRDMGAPAVRDMVSEEFRASIDYMAYVPGAGNADRGRRGCIGLHWRVLVGRREVEQSVVLVERVG